MKIVHMKHKKLINILPYYLNKYCYNREKILKIQNDDILL